MDSTSCKTSCALLLVLMMMVLTKGASINCDHGKKDLHPEHTVPLEVDPKLLTPVTGISPLNNISISPWAWNTSHDASLYPPVSEARCLLEGCLINGQEDFTWQSRPIFHQILTLRKVHSPSGQGYHYRLEEHIVAVGCTCVQHVVQQQQ